MATIQRPMANQSTWEYLRRMAGARVGAYLSGQYTYNFSNASDRTVKLHLSEDRQGSASQAGGRQDYFLTVPAGASGIEVPMRSDMISVDAGFFRPDLGAYEIFWERRRFSWEANMIVQIASRHSVDSNPLRVDVFPGAPAVAKPRAAPAFGAGARGDGGRSGAVVPAESTRRPPARQDRAAFPVAGGRPHVFRPTRLPLLPFPEIEEEDDMADHDPGAGVLGMRVFSQRPGGARGGGCAGAWVGCDVVRALEDGSLEVRDAEGGGRSWNVRPAEQASLVPLPPGIEDWRSLAASGFAGDSYESSVSDMAPPPRHLRHPGDKIREVAGSRVPSYGSYATTVPSPGGASHARR